MNTNDLIIYSKKVNSNKKDIELMVNDDKNDNSEKNFKPKDKHKRNKHKLYLDKRDENNNSNSKTNGFMKIEDSGEVKNLKDNRKKKQNEEKKDELDDEFAENNISIRSIINNALFTQLSEIRVNLLELNEETSQQLYHKKEKMLPKIDYVEFTLLNQGTNIASFKQYGFGIYVFFLYLIKLLVTFFLLAIFAFNYIYNIFKKYYQDLDVECSLYFECNILSLASGAQLKHFRKYYIERFGKEAFLEKHKNFDVIYKEYIFTGLVLFIIAFLIDFFYIIYLQRSYKAFQLEYPEIKNYSLILSGNVPYLEEKDIMNNTKEQIEEKKAGIKRKILSEFLDNKKADIFFTLKLSEYYEKIEKLVKKRKKLVKLQHHIDYQGCFYKELCCYCGICFCCCCSKEALTEKRNKINAKIDEELMKDLKKLNPQLEINHKYNPLYIITLHNKEDYEEIYSKYPHSYLNFLCKDDSEAIYINKAPSPEDIAWENLEFNKGHDYFSNKFKNLGVSIVFLAFSFGLQLLIEWICSLEDGIVYQIFFNIVLSFVQEFINEKFEKKVNKYISGNFNSWSHSDITFYSILYNTVFKFINTGLFPFLTYIILEKDDNYSNLVAKLFVVMEMDGFGFPIIDLVYIVKKKGSEMYESTQSMMSAENVDKEFKAYINNKEKESLYSLKQQFEKPEFELEDHYSDILTIYWMTMFYLSLYPIGVFQSFLNILFKFIIEKNFLLNIYKRPEYINPHFGFLCFNFFHFGFFLYLLGDLIFFRNEDNKKSFGIGYIIIMILALVFPFYYLAKLLMYITNNCCLEEKNEKLKSIKQKLKSDYRIFNPCYQKEGIINLFEAFYNNDNINNCSNNDINVTNIRKNNLLTQSKFKEITDKIEELNSLDLYYLQQNMRIKKEMTFFKKELDTSNIYNDYSMVEEEEEQKLYYLLMQLGFLSYLEEGKVFQSTKGQIDIDKNIKLRSPSLAVLSHSSLKENFCTAGAGPFTIFKRESDLILVYVVNQTSIQLFDIFNRKVKNQKNLNKMKQIVCIDYFDFIINNQGTEEEEERKTIKHYLVTIALDNTMVISNLSSKKDKTQFNIGDKFDKYEDKINSNFSLSIVKHEENKWIITSYYYDRYFKIFEYSSNDKLLIYKKAIPNNDEFIISLKGIYFN